MLVTALLSVLLAAPPVMTRHEVGGLSIELLEGEASRRSKGEEGMLRTRTAAVDQLFYWNEAKGTSLRARAEHERGLLVKAAADATTSRVDPITESKAGDRASWGAVVDQTVFRSTVAACGKRHVLLSTMGPEVRAVEDAHRRSMASLVCR